MLKQRVWTALVLLLILIPAVLESSGLAFGVVSAIAMVAAAWEWGRLNTTQSGLVWLGTVAVAVLCAIALWFHLQLPSWLWLWVSALWMLGGAWCMHRGVSAWSSIPAGVRLLLGWCLIAVAWFAAVKAKAMGIPFLLTTMSLVWIADIMAYFSGKAFGGRWIQRKLAPSLSPGKSWEGAIGGLLCVLAFAWAMQQWSVVHVFFSLQQHLMWLWPLAVVFLVVASVMGDLLESLVKRSAGAKDSSGLLPGHGGVLDRVDALLPVLPMALWLVGV
ncbi:phosphatidate cytidylyltransferase [Curvibacter sp. CHRR-16]|uniref:phosphatidate cytidylyltransferase n=1 Tax=Curvibacter sp. CHRR-16 TaxID=2835872 RepID=UPI001BD986D1|nr:phosphatidate cytidylyltransferase [Curvibacter sp. CHRR-16]MBT0570861.1 phosphatidate cytidylyltransferase [Curvibacter sp. CHRR-16]